MVWAANIVTGLSTRVAPLGDSGGRRAGPNTQQRLRRCRSWGLWLQLSLPLARTCQREICRPSLQAPSA
jgi:hypothetical protein